MKLKKLKSKLGFAFVGIYLIFVILGFMDFFSCNGFQFHAYHGKCALGLFLLEFSPATLPIIVFIRSLGIAPDNSAVIMQYLMSAFFITINILFYYFLGLGIEFIFKKIRKK